MRDVGGRLLASWALVLSAVLPATALAQERPEEYTVGPGDILHVAVLGQTEMTGDFPVDTDGALRFPFLGPIPAGGRTTAELERKMVELLADGYLKNPRVSVMVKEFHNLRVFVTGEVVRPGAYGLRPNRSLLELLGDVGAMTANAGHEVVVIRPPLPPTETGREVPPTAAGSKTPEVSALPGDVPGAELFRVSLRTLRSGDPERDFRLRPGDTIFVPKAAQFYVTGHVAHAGAFRFEEGMTVHQAVNLAGGITDRASSKVKLIRILNGQRKEISAKPGDLVQPEDTIVVPERFF